MKKVVIIGAGRIFNKHFEAIKSLKKSYEIVGVFDSNHERNIISAKKDDVCHMCSSI